MAAERCRSASRDGAQDAPLDAAKATFASAAARRRRGGEGCRPPPSPRTCDSPRQAARSPASADRASSAFRRISLVETCAIPPRRLSPMRHTRLGCSHFPAEASSGRSGRAEAQAGRQGRIANHPTRLELVVFDEPGYLPPPGRAAGSLPYARTFIRIKAKLAFDEWPSRVRRPGNNRRAAARPPPIAAIGARPLFHEQ